MPCSKRAPSRAAWSCRAGRRDWMSIATLLTRSAQLWPDKPALIDSIGGRTISFAGLARAAFFVGHTLRQRGLEAGDRVALLGDATADYLCADYGIMSAGLVR